MTALTVDDRPHVVIVGAGFGGLETAKALGSEDVRVTIIDKRNHHLFQPLLYQVAMAGLAPSEIAIPIRSVLSKHANIEILMGEVVDLDLDRQEIDLEDGERIGFDFLVFAVGAKNFYFGHDEWAEHATGLKSLEDAIEIRRRVLLAFERAEREADPEERRRLLTFAIIGGGPTGVELAGALSELSRHVLARDYHRVDADEVRVVLVEGLDRVLGGFAPELSESAKKQLEELNVELRLGKNVSKIDEDGVEIGDERIETRTVVWGAGVAPVGLARHLDTPLDDRGRVIVEDDCSIPTYPEAFAIGDVARFEAEDGSVLPGVSPVAMQQARYVADLIIRRTPKAARRRFEYLDKGMMATIGRSRAVAQTKRLRMSGPLAWLAWLFIHLWYLVGFKNRIFVLMQWVFSYAAYRRGARLITGQSHRSTKSPRD